MNNVMNDFMIRVFPNSGHQYETILLSEILPDWEDQDIRTLRVITRLNGSHGMPSPHGFAIVTRTVHPNKEVL